MIMKKSDASDFSRISVVVPVRNEAASIRILIEGLLNQTLSPNEIVITDGGSTDTTITLLEQMMAESALIKLLREKEALPGRGRNVGVANSRNKWIAFIDGGIRPERTWLEKLASKACQEQADVVYGSYRPVIESFFTECAALAYVPPPENVDGVLGRWRFIASTLMHRRVWEEVSGFPEGLRSAEDLLFMRRVEQAGFRVARAADAIVHWNLQPNLWRTFKRFATYARNNIRAGLWREWQLAIFLRYALVFVSIVPTLLFGWQWLFVPAGLWLGIMIARAAKSIHNNRAVYPAKLARNVARLVLLVPILSAIDAAVFIGSIDWLVRDKLRLGKKKR